MKRIITVEIDTDEKKIFVSEENSSGSVYDGETPTDVGFAVECYLEDNDYEV